MNKKIKLFFLLLILGVLNACVSTPEPEAEPAAIPTGNSYVQTGNSYVQAGAFAVPSNARRMVARLQNLGYVADAVHGSVRGTPVKLIRIHDLRELDALSICSNLKASGIDCFTNARRGSIGTNSNYVSPHAAPITGVLTETWSATGSSPATDSSSAVKKPSAASTYGL